MNDQYNQLLEKFHKSKRNKYNKTKNTKKPFRINRREGFFIINTLI